MNSYNVDGYGALLIFTPSRSSHYSYVYVISCLVDDQWDFVNNFREHRNSVYMYKPRVLLYWQAICHTVEHNIQCLHHLALALLHRISYLRLKLFRCTYSIGLCKKKIVWTSYSSIFTTCFVKKILFLIDNKTKQI